MQATFQATAKRIFVRDKENKKTFPVTHRVLLLKGNFVQGSELRVVALKRNKQLQFSFSKHKTEKPLWNELRLVPEEKDEAWHRFETMDEARFKKFLRAYRIEHAYDELFAA